MNRKRFGSRFTNISILVAILLWTVAVGAMLLFTNKTIRTVSGEEGKESNIETLAFVPQTVVLHLQGNTEETCSGVGNNDFTVCNGPFLDTNSVLSTNSAAFWNAPVGLNTATDRGAGHTEPNWMWNLPGATRIGGPMTINWWASCGACGPTGNADWNIRVWADGALGFEQRIRATPTLPNVPSLLSTTVFLPEINANTKIVIHIDAVFIDSQQNTKIYYDSMDACPGASGSGPCDSTVSMTVLEPGDPVPTPTPIPNDDPPPPLPAACEVPTFDNYQPPALRADGSAYPRRDSSAEPSMGVNWNTGNVMTMSRFNGNRTTFDDSTSPANPLTTSWFSQAIPVVVVGADPILFTDSITGRTIGGELVVAAGSTDGFVSDNDLNDVTANFTTGGAVQGVDHQTIGAGPPKVDPADPIITARQPVTNYPNLFYYASQQIAYGSVATSFDGGITYQTAVTAYTLAQCGGLHGHLKVAPDGTVYLPNKNCGGRAAVVVSEDNGLNWQVRQITDSTSGSEDPQIGIGAGGKLYVSYTDALRRVRVAVSDDKGQTWHDDFSLMNSTPTTLTTGVFPSVTAGDNDRAAVFFLATDSTDTNNPLGTDGGAADGTDTDPTDDFKGTWFPYMAVTCDGGKSWSVVRADNDPLHVDPGTGAYLPNPAQQGPVCRNGTTCPDDGVHPVRNLLDFNDANLDTRGRILAVYADGCNTDHPCINITDNSATRNANQSVARLTIIRQRSGMRLFSAFDPSGPIAPSLSPPVQVKDEKQGYSLYWPTPDDGGSKLLRYRIYRGEEGKKEKQIAEVSAYLNKFTDKKISKSRDGVYYRVTAVNKFGESPKNVKFLTDRE